MKKALAALTVVAVLSFGALAFAHGSGNGRGGYGSGMMGGGMMDGGIMAGGSMGGGMRGGDYCYGNDK